MSLGFSLSPSQNRESRTETGLGSSSKAQLSYRATWNVGINFTKACNPYGWLDYAFKVRLHISPDCDYLSQFSSQAAMAKINSFLTDCADTKFF